MNCWDSWFTTAQFDKREARKPLFDVPEVKPIDWKHGAIGVTVLAGLGLGLGVTMGTYIIAGAISLAGLIYIVETNKYIKYAAVHAGRLLDVLLLGATVLATIYLGVTIGIVLTFTGLGFTVYLIRLRSKNK